MAKYCGMCGKELEPGSKFCVSCGNPVEGTRRGNVPDVGNGQRGSEALPMYPANRRKREKGRNKRIAVMMSAVLVMVIIVAAGIGIVKTKVNGYKMPIKYFCEYMNTGDTDYIEKMVPQKAEKKLSKEFFYGDWIRPDVVASYDSVDEYVEESADKFLEYAYLEPMEELRDDFMEEFGSDFQIEYEISEKEEIDEEDILGEWKSEIFFYQEYGIEVKFYRVETKLKIKGSGGRDTQKVDFRVANFEGEWTLLCNY